MGIFDFRKKQPGEGTPAPAPATPPGAPGAAGNPAPPASASGAADQPPPVQALDAFGRPVQVPREVWQQQVLPEMLKAAGSDPERLAAAILQALRDGFAADVVPAANRLSVLDRDVERGLSILAAVQRATGEVEVAAATLRELLQKKPSSAAARTGLAALADQRGDRAECERLLWEALAQDSNHPDALFSALELARRDGAAAHQQAVARASALPLAWRSKLVQARLHLDAGSDELAVAAYREVAGIAGDESDTLLAMASEFGRKGWHDLTAELVLPRYQVGKHHPQIGVLLLQHYVETHKPGPGQALLHELRLRFPRVLDGQLARLDMELARLQQPTPPAVPSGPAKVGLFRLDHPLWLHGLDAPDWLLPKKEAGLRPIVFAGLAVQHGAPMATGVQREDEGGRLSRSVPLFLAEALWMLSPQQAAAALALAEVGGWVVTGTPWPEERLQALLPEEERARALLVTGTVRLEEARRRVDLWVYDAVTSQRIGHAAAEGEVGQLGRVLQQLLAELQPHLGGPEGLPKGLGNDAWWERYLAGLGQHAAMVVAGIGALPKDRLYGQRAILEWLLGLAIDESRWQPAKWALCSALCLDAALGSPIHREFAQPFFELWRREPPNTGFAALACKPLRLLGLQNFWQQRRAQIWNVCPEPVRAWITRVEAAAPPSR